ncbi:TRAP transporter solute receptor, TAXI family precursor [Caenispirillum salinarum AK4]|uniref:TRAP transporter solute receptor, TAXI family n=1 Tax=Caenispirillum salinarum AK4 TaxID=1238182 RepID=K9HJ60_9PROT|nr:TAXI family TRAP transporter solute-binding subunit [Caenispirillum salinarum]EKV28631.1 TRAP transporter solute receptor, TAXI family precursor [Caenispirillum salinarum AK4]
MISRRGFVAATAIAGLGLGLTVADVQDARAQDTNYLLATASTGGTYYPVGVALATLTKVKLQPGEGIGMSAINSAGSGENIKLIREKQAQFAILQGLYGYYAAQGVGPLEQEGKQDHLRSVSMLWQNVEHFVVDDEHRDSGTMSDFVNLPEGAKVALGRQNSGTLGSNRTILGNLGVDIDEHFDLMYAGYTPSAEALQNGQVAGISTPAGVPVGAVTQLMAAAGGSVAPLDFTDEQVAEANGEMDLWSRYTIPAGTYPGQEAEWNTIAQPNFLAVHADVPEEHVYLITKTVYENLPFLQAIHPATKAMALEKAIAGLPAPLHPGAARYYAEQGVEIPEKLMAK